MSSRRKPVIYIDGEPYPDEEEDPFRPPEHAAIEGAIEATELLSDFMVKPADNIGKAFKYLLKAITFSD